MIYQTIRLDIDARGVATLTLARPDKHNALNAEMIGEVTDAAGRLATDPAVRVVVLAGAGASFCAGGDLGWMRAQFDKDRAAKMADALALAAMLGALDGLPKPLIGRVHGNAFGGGIGMMAVCDAVIAARGAVFALTETRLGLIPATIGPYVVRRLGEGRARRIFMSGRRFGADEAVAMGLAAAAVDAADLDDAVAAEIAPYLDCAPGAVAEAKALCLRLARDLPVDAAAFTAGALADRWETEEARAGIAAFFDKRPAPWKL